MTGNAKMGSPLRGPDWEVCAPAVADPESVPCVGPSIDDCPERNEGGSGAETGGWICSESAIFAAVLWFFAWSFQFAVQFQGTSQKSGNSNQYACARATNNSPVAQVWKEIVHAPPQSHAGHYLARKFPTKRRHFPTKAGLLQVAIAPRGG